MTHATGSYPLPSTPAAPRAELLGFGRDSLAQQRLGAWYVLATPFFAGAACLQGIFVGGTAYTGLMWMGLLAAGVLIFLVEKSFHRDSLVHLPLAPWTIWIGLLWLSLAWCAPRTGRNVQDALQISMPVLVGMLASMFIRTQYQARLLLQAFWFAIPPIVGGVLLWKVGLIGSGEDGSAIAIAPRVMALSLVMTGCALAALWPAQKFAPLVGWGLCVLLTFVSGSRTATAVLLLVPIMHPLYRSRALRISMCLGAILLAVGLFYTPSFQQRFFYEGSGTLTDLFQGNFLGFGRFEAWPIIWDEAWQHPVLGVGVGSTYDYVPTVWDDMHHVHNDYLRIGFELGLVGLAIFLLVVLWQLVDLKRLLRRTSGPTQQITAAAMMGLFVFLMAAATDNPLVYNLWITNPLFALIGAAYGTAASSQAALAAATGGITETLAVQEADRT